MITIVVEGGPEGLGRVWEIDAPVVPERWVVAFYGRHQHYERTGATVLVEGRQLSVFQFTYSTAIAE
ncbi:DUF5988 family protein [Streptomyces sp. CBMA152]|uniref:DUF5988 family protein n=1 Tax=Streptomyces sp. CBMA152 TaxID=1896312 RepID=UPI00166131AD|nr:DUF5988 family protein [Streptomyces sp. CBMA152]MBD0746745.1 hypothetical protein [Streptomyces sp. CBMA152]